METAEAPPAGNALPDWRTLFDRAQKSSAWLEMLDRGRRANIRDVRAEARSPTQWTIRDLVIDLDADLVDKLDEAPVKPRVMALYADVVRVRKGLAVTLEGSALIIAARRIEIDGNATVVLDYRKSKTASLLLYAGEITGELIAMPVVDKTVPRKMPITTSEKAAGLWLHASEGTPALEERPTLPSEWAQSLAPALRVAASTFQMAAVLMATQPDIAASMLQHIVRFAALVPAKAAHTAEWLELGRASTQLLASGAAAAKTWAIDYGRLLFRGTPAFERKRKADELERVQTSKMVAVPYELLRTTAPAPEAEHPRYIRHAAQPLGLGELNGVEQPLRSVTLTGAEIILEDLDRSQFLKTYAGKTDIQELTIHADTLVIRCGLHFPQTEVTIFCRALYFEGPDALIDTTPVDDGHREPLEIDGRNGATGGSITLHIGRFGTTEAKACHFRARGGKGQDPDDGGFTPSLTVRYLPRIVEADWANLFTYTNRQVDTGTVSTPLWDTFKDDKIVYVELKIGGKVIATKGEKAEPGTGGAGKVPGRPGMGGMGGTVRSTLDEVFAYTDVSGGDSAKARGPSKGGAGGLPTDACWLFFEDELESGIRVLKSKREIKKAVKGPDSAPGPEAFEPQGGNGACELLTAAEQDSWRTALNLGVAVQFARDALASAHPAQAREYLVPYLQDPDAVIDSDKDAGAVSLSQLTRHAVDLAEQALRNVDDFGNPPGWVPMLSLESNVDAYLKIIRPSMAELYTAYCLQRAWKAKADRQSTLEDFSRVLTDQTEETRKKLTDTRASIAPLVGQLKELLGDMEKTQKRLDGVKVKLEQREDRLFASEEGKRILAETFKILGAVIKAIPLPEPYQAATAGLGMIFDTAGNLIDKEDTAFTALNKDLEAFSKDNADSLATIANKNLETAIERSGKDIKALQETASETKKENQALTDAHDEKMAAHKEMMEKETAIYEMAKEALLYGRTDDKEKLVEEAAGLTADFQKFEKDQEAKLKATTGEYKEKKKLMDRQDGAIKAQEKKLASQKEELTKKKAASQKSIKDGIKKMQGVVGGIESIRKSIDRLSVPKAQLNTEWDKALAKLKVEDPEFQAISGQLAYLNVKKAEITAKLSRLQADLTEQKNEISTNLVTVHELSMQIANAHEALAPQVAVYAQALGQDAHRDLQQFLYYVVKAYEYQRVAPWDTPYHDAQKLFEDMRNVLEPSDFRYTFVDETDGEKRREELRKLLAEPASARDGTLTPSEFDLLRVVYEKPLRDMGKQLLRQLEASGSSRESKSGITLRAAELRELNHKIERREPAVTAFDLVRLGQLNLGKERQRIADIRVTKVRCRLLQPGGHMPDSVSFRFTRQGKSLVRADGRIYAFEPEGGGDRSSAVSFETFGGKSDKAGWRIDDGVGVLEGAALWPPSPPTQESLLAQLLAGDKDPHAANLVKLSDFRPGVFSDFVLNVTVTPPEARIALEEVELFITTEGTNAPDDQWIACVSVNVPTMIPLSTSKADLAGHAGGLGRYVGVFKRTDAPVELSVPASFGELTHCGWLINGDHKRGPTISLEQSSYVVALYEAGQDKPVS
ncbi:hypothetical protein QTH97_32430 [Variovorax sp. J22R24]|uniref:hypothetical protein n=1 Tax=Variovorax gracilis TaxID=3053502 RepID=UPI002577A3BE|nr:hypothetical protein [Variovorax sp. J22R24]MDM0109666.1 hypothetical protein [Variovorax sp. J22R24]